MVEGREYPSFQPADPGMNAGYTRDLRNNKVWYPEWVHGPILMYEVEYIGPASEENSQVPAGPVPDGYLEEKLS